MAERVNPTVEAVPSTLQLERESDKTFHDEQGLRELLRSFAWEVALRRPADPARCIYDMLMARFEQKAVPKTAASAEAASGALMQCELTMENVLDIFHIQGPDVLKLVETIIGLPRPWNAEATVKKIAHAAAELQKKDVSSGEGLEGNVTKHMKARSVSTLESQSVKFSVVKTRGYTT